MKENILKCTVAVVVAGLSAYLGALFIPLAVLIAVIIMDYCTGMIKAWITKTINSNFGLTGIIKKLCYLLVVCVGGVVDWLIGEAFLKAGIEYQSVFFIGLLVVIWLIINELISILENLATIGVPLPAFLLKVVSRLKVAAESGISDQ